MHIFKISRTVGISAGAAIFVAFALLSTIAANKPSTEKSLTPGAITDSIVALTEQLGRAFAAVAAHVKPAVVTVCSEKTKEQDDGILETTTEIHLARGIGEALHHAFKGELEFHYNQLESLLRVVREL